MLMSSRRIPAGTKVSIFEEPVVGHAGLSELSPKLASIFARWSAIEKLLDHLFVLITDADENKLAKFDELRGWDRRTKAICAAAKAAASEEVADLTKIILRIAKIPAKKRDELAHGVWAIAEGFEGQLLLLPSNTQHLAALAVVRAKAAGTGRIALDNRQILENGALVSAADLNLLIAELRRARSLLDALISGYYYPRVLDCSGEEFADHRSRIESSEEVTRRLVSVKRARLRNSRNLGANAGQDGILR